MNEIVNYRIQKRKLLRKVVIFIEPDSDDNDDLQSSNTDKIEDHIEDHIEYIKYDIHEMFSYSRNSTQYNPDDGSIVVTPHFRYFPNEIISLIVRQLFQQQQQNDLYSCTLVNKQFYQETNHLLWFAPNISNAARLNLLLTCLTDAQQTKTGHHIRKLELRGRYWTDTEFSLLMPYICRLEELKIGFITSLSITCVDHFPRYCRYLTSLTFGNVPVSQSCLVGIVQSCQQLRHLSLNTEFAPTDIFKTLAACPLVSLDLPCGGVGRRWNEMLKGLKGLHHLKRLAFVKEHAYPSDLLCAIDSNYNNNNNLDDSTSSTSIIPWPLLSQLDINGCSNMDDALFKTFFKSHHHIQDLCLRKSVFSNTTLHAMSTYLPRLTFLEVTKNPYITPYGVHQLVRNCLRLERAVFTGCGRLSLSMFPASENSSEDSIILNQTKIDEMRRNGK